MKTLKVFKYKGTNIYIRQLHGESFEFLIPWKGEILENLIEFNKEKGRKKLQYTGEEMQKIVDSLEEIAKQVIDERSGTLLKKFNNIFNAKYNQGNKRADIISEQI